MIGNISQSAVDIPVLEKCDILVVGGGLSGVAAAIKAARRGKKVVIVAERGYFGREITASFVAKLDPADKELEPPLKYEILDEMGDVGGYQGNMMDISVLQMALDRLITAAGVKTYFHSRGTKAFTDDGEVTGIIMANKSGRQAILSAIVVDAAEEAHITASAGARFFDSGAEGKIKRCFTMNLANYIGNEEIRVPDDIPVSNGKIFVNPTLWEGEYLVTFFLDGIYDSTRVEDVTKMEIETRRGVIKITEFLRNNVSGFETAMLTESGNEALLMSGKRIIGVETLTIEQVIKGRSMPPGIPAVIMREGELGTESVAFFIPYGCLIPQGVKNLIVASSHISVDEQLQPFLLQFANALQLGEGAGEMAANMSD